MDSVHVILNYLLSAIEVSLLLLLVLVGWLVDWSVGCGCWLSLLLLLLLLLHHLILLTYDLLGASRSY